jgi:molecular chaperone Hsp33
MRKKKIYGDTFKEQLNATSRDRLLHFTLLDGTIRGAILHATKLVNEMRANHELGVLETLVLGHAYIGILLMSSTLKGDDSVAIRIDCRGPAKGLDVEANSFGEVRGFLFQNPIPISKPPESFDLRPFIVDGRMTVTRFLEKAKRPYSGQVELFYGTIAKDLAYYCTVSEQLPSTFDLSVKFDRGGAVAGAGGLVVQALPGAREKDLIKLERTISQLPSIGEAFSANRDAEGFLMAEFTSFNPFILEQRRAAFMCHCSRGKFGGYLRQLPLTDLCEIATDEKEHTVLTCRKCNTSYKYSKKEIQAIFQDARHRRS